MWCIHVLSLCVPTGNTGLALLLAGPGVIEMWQPRLCWAAGFGNPEYHVWLHLPVNTKYSAPLT